MKGPWWLAFLVCIAIAWYFIKGNPPKSELPPTTSQSSPIQNQKIPRPEDQPPSAAAPIFANRSKISSSAPSIPVEPPAANTTAQSWALAQTKITFRIDNNWAIAYGDVLLGTVTAPSTVTVGTHEPDRPRLWESAVIPYAIHEDVPRPERIQAAIRYFNENTPIKFVPLETEGEDAVVFVADKKNCASYVGRIGGPQPIMVADRCGRQELIHELMHALGFVHEHSRNDRDQYVEIMWDDIEPQYWPQFAMVPEIMIADYQGRAFDFDPSSAMHYPPSAFPRTPGKITVRAKAGVAVAPTSDGLSAKDRERLTAWYGHQ